MPVDVELVIAVDISYSMDPEEQALQREGYIQALTSREFLQALRKGIHGKIAVTYFEWAGYTERRVVVPWRLIEGPESADAFVGEIAAAPIRRAARTSISGAIEFGADLFEGSGYRGIRRVIDISGDGANNHGQLVTVSRDDAVAKGITINGLPIVAKRLNYADHGYREARHLLRGLRDRRPRRLRHPDREQATSSSTRRAPSSFWKSPAACRKRASFPCPPTSRACPAPSASGCGRSAGGIYASSSLRCHARAHASGRPRTDRRPSTSRWMRPPSRAITLGREVGTIFGRGHALN